MNRRSIKVFSIKCFAVFTALSFYSSGGAAGEIMESIDKETSAVSMSLGAALKTAVIKNYSGIVRTDILNVRNGPWGEIIGTLKQDANVDIITKEGVWFKINFNGGTGLVHSGYVETLNAPATAYDAFVYASGSYLNVRNGPRGDIIGKLYHGDTIEILGKQGDWYQIKYNNDEAYAHSNFIFKYKPAPDHYPAPKDEIPAPQTAASGGGNFGGRPVIGGSVTGEFHERNRSGTYHHGIDIGVSTGTPLKSIGSGTVISTAFYTGGGKIIEIKYDNGYTSIYMHCKKAIVSPGNRVKQGQLVGYTNNTGTQTTGPHLHFELKDPRGKSINPRSGPGVII